MANVKLRTIINEDNSTTFQVQFEDGKWADLTWDMISNKPFETLDNTVFIVDENGVLTITDTPINWSDIGDKPFITLNPSDFEVSASGVLSYKGSIDWADILGKPFNSLNDNDFEIQNGVLSVKHQTIPNQNWSQIQQKPFNSLDPTTFQVVGGILYLNTNPDITYWNDIQNKPFSFIDNNTLEVVDDTLKAKAPTIPNQTWSQIENKPFSSLNPTDFSVNESGEASVNFPAQTPDSWNSVTDKPFETIGSGLSVDPETKALKAEGVSGTVNWNDIQNKPFSFLDSNLFNVYEGGLSIYPHMWFKTEMANDHKINTDGLFKNFIFNYISNSYNKRFGLDNPFDGWYCPVFDDDRILHIKNKIKIDRNPITNGNTLSDTYILNMKLCSHRMFQTDTMDTFYIDVDVSGMPMIINGASIVSVWRGIAVAIAHKENGQYTSVGANNAADLQMLTYSEAKDIYAYTH